MNLGLSILVAWSIPFREHSTSILSVSYVGGLLETLLDFVGKKQRKGGRSTCWAPVGNLPRLFEGLIFIAYVL